MSKRVEHGRRKGDRARQPGDGDNDPQDWRGPQRADRDRRVSPDTDGSARWSSYRDSAAPPDLPVRQ